MVFADIQMKIWQIFHSLWIVMETLKNYEFWPTDTEIDTEDINEEL